MAFVRTAARGPPSSPPPGGAGAGSSTGAPSMADVGPTDAQGSRYEGRLCRDDQKVEEGSIAVQGQYGSKVRAYPNHVVRVCVTSQQCCCYFGMSLASTWAALLLLLLVTPHVGLGLCTVHTR